MQVDWYAERVQLALFVGPNWTRRPLFVELTGIEPENISEQGQVQLRQETGPFADAYLGVMQRPGRIDIALSDLPSANTSNPEAPNYKKFFWIDKLDRAVSAFDKIIDRLPNFPAPLQRIGYILAIIYPADDAQSAMSALHQSLPLVTFDPANDTDLW